jgi:DNA-binding response OmpR family regulator
MGSSALDNSRCEAAMYRIAIIEDVPVDSDRLKTLITDSLDAEVLQAYSKAEAEKLLAAEKLDLVIMDIELGAGPKDRYAGLGLLSDMRGKTWPTIVVSGMPEENLRGLALTLHAYEFIPKPVDDQDFIHKVEHALAWESTDAGKDLFGTVGWPEGLSADPNRKNMLLWKGRPVRLTITELSIVQCLIEQPGGVVENRRLLANLKSTSSLKALAAHVSGARSKFREIDPTFDRIDNEPAKGYVWKTEPK